MFVGDAINILSVYFQNGSLGHSKKLSNTGENNKTFLFASISYSQNVLPWVCRQINISAINEGKEVHFKDLKYNCNGIMRSDSLISPKT